MFSKVLPVIVLVAYAQAGVISLGPQATSYSSINNIGAQLNSQLVLGPSIDSQVLLKPQLASHTILGQSLVAPTLLSSGLVSQNLLKSSLASPVLIRSPLASQTILKSQISPLVSLGAAPLVKTIQKEIYADAIPQYAYQYGVKDLQTGDIKEQQEEREGDVVKGAYSLVQPDGVTRTVRYSADGINGFNAQVDYNGQVVQKALVAKAVVPTQLIY